jgi:putative hemolysin
MLIEQLPWLVAMGVLILASAFCSSSEAAWFYLRHSDRREMAQGNRAQRIAAALLDDPDRLLTAILFGNLLANLAYFTISSIIGLQLQRQGHSTLAGSFTVGSLMLLIALGEMLPKSLGVLVPRTLATWFAVPLAMVVRLIDPALPVFRTAITLSRRLIWPDFQSEPYLRVGDLERAVKLSTSDAALLEQEQTILQRIVLLSEIRADELMRPRTQFTALRPPVSLADLKGPVASTGYLLITELDTDEVALAVDLATLSSVPAEHLEFSAQAVVCVPWCATVAATLEAMRQRDRRVAAVVNELGETIGVLTFDDILDTIFTRQPSRSQRLLKRVPIRCHAPGVWHVTGMTSLRRLVRHFNVSRPPSQSVTVAGVVQETLQRFPEPGDVCRWGPFQFRVLETPDHGQLIVELTMPPDEDSST